jgi:hypothetical protein
METPHPHGTSFWTRAPEDSTQALQHPYEHAYVEWIRRFILFHGRRDVSAGSEPQFDHLHFQRRPYGQSADGSPRFAFVQDVLRRTRGKP